MFLEGSQGLKLAADVFGPEGGPPALLLHGMGQTRQSWGQAGARLGAQGWRAYAIDLRGHGDSDWPAAYAYDNDDLAADVLALCRQLGTPLLVGASMGGVCALAAQGTSEQQLFKGMVLVDIAPDVDMEGGRRIVNFMSAKPEGYADLDEAAEAIGAYRGGGRKPSTAGLTRVLKQRDNGRWYWHWDPRILEPRLGWLNDADAAAEYGQMMRTTMVGGAERLTVPTLLVRGGSSDVVSVAAAQALKEIVPQARYVDVADASHMVAGDRNDVFVDAILEFAAPLLAR